MAYFGYCNADGTVIGTPPGSTGWSGEYVRTKAYTCPGIGSQKVLSYAVNIKIASGSGNIRVGIYRQSDGALLADSGIVAVSNTSYQWIGASPAGLFLRGGTDYNVAFTTNNNSVDLPFTNPVGTGNIFEATGVAYTVNGLPNPSTNAVNQPWGIPLRIEVFPAGSNNKRGIMAPKRGIMAPLSR